MNLLACIAERWRARHLRCRGRVIVRGRLRVHGSGDVLVEDGTRFDAGPVGIELQPSGLSRIHIGTDCVVADGVTIEARQLVQLGRRVIVGRGARILDNHFHPLRGNRHHYPASRPVIIEDDVVIGADAIILAGVRVGAGARVAPAAVVTHPVAAGAAVAGNPARRVSAS